MKRLILFVLVVLVLVFALGGIVSSTHLGRVDSNMIVQGPGIHGCLLAQGPGTHGTTC